MGIIIRQSVKASLSTYVGVAIGAFNFLWLFPKCLDPAQIGLLQLAQGMAFVLATFAQLGSPNLVDRFFPQFQERSQHAPGLLFLCLTLPLAGITLLSAWWSIFPSHWQELFAERSPEVIPYGGAILTLTVSIIYLAVLEAYARAHLRIVVPSITREVGLRVAQSLLAAGYLTGYYPFPVVMYGLVTSYVLAAFVLVAYLLHLGMWDWKPDFRLFNATLRREMLSFGLFVILGGAGALLVARVDSLMLGALAGSYELGIYATAFFIGTVIEIPRRAISLISLPLIGQYWQTKDRAKLVEVYQQSSLNLILVGGWVFAGVWSNIDDLFFLMPNGAVFAAGKYVVLFIGLARLVDMATGVSSGIILQSRHYRFNMVSVLILAGLLIITNWVLIPRLGIEGAALGTFSSVLTFGAVKGSFLWYHEKMQPFTWKTLLAIGIILGGIGVGHLIPPSQGGAVKVIGTILVRSLALTGFTAVAVVWLRPSAEVNLLWRKVYEQLPMNRKR